MSETLITANVPEWITALMGFLAMVTGLGLIAFLWKSLKPLVDERIDFKTVETNKRLDRLENKSDRQDEGISENRKSIDRIKELEHKQDLSINQLVSDVKHMEKSIADLSKQIDAYHQELSKKIDSLHAFLLNK
ncbi:hypothetical protein UFOVP457_23 [uncultured Caudovirales phage]|jgi:hypothetical protein|uniref:Uncharacterized protein n=1 Tax=uncultured Caudovirales phage TaxID=2100421 RepID=A0A6J5MGB0_9CAUD|nr:hypothetical protein UFOVP457_23 [uncultured Caudovirales phage]